MMTQYLKKTAVLFLLAFAMGQLSGCWCLRGWAVVAERKPHKVPRPFI